MTNPLKFAMVFTAETSALKAGTQEAKAEVAGVTKEADQATAALDKNAAALDRNAAAAKKAAAAARDQANAEKEARDAANRASAAKPAETSPASAPSAPASSPSAPSSSPALPPSSPGPKSAPTPGNDNIAALRAQYAPLIASQEAYEKKLADIAKLEQAGALTSNQLAEAKARAKKSYDDEAESIKRATPLIDGQTRSIKLSSYERSLMNRNISDTAQGLALGMPIQQVLLQQGPQIVDIYGGIGNAAKAAAGFITVGTVAVAATVAAFLLAGKALDGYLNSTKAVSTAANGLGRSVAGTSESLEASARAGAAAAGISVTAARSMEVAFLRTGKIGSENYEQLIALSKDFAATMGIDAKDAGSALADMFSDPAAAAQKLYSQYGLLDGATADYIQHLTAQNRLSEAQGVLAKALPGQLASATESTNAFARAWDAVSTAASNAWDSVGKGVNDAISGKSGQERIDELKKILELPRVRGREGVQAELDGLLAQQAAEEKKRQDAAANQKGAAAVGIAAQSPANTTARQIQSTKDSIAALQSGLNAPNLSEDQTAQINDAIKAKTALLAGLEHQQERLSRVDQLDIAIQNEKNPVLRAQLTEQRTKISLSLQEVNATEAAAEAQRAGNAVINQAVATSAAQARDMASEIQIRNKLNAEVASGTLSSADMQTQLQKELELRPLVAAAASAEGERKKQLEEVIKDLSAGYDGLAAAQKATAGNDYLRSQTDSLEKLRLQSMLVGQNELTQQKANAALQAEQEIRARGLDANGAMAKQIRENAQAAAELTDEVRKQSDAWDDVKKSTDGAIDSLFTGLKNGNLKDAGKSILSDFEDTLLKLGGSNPLKNLLLGEDNPTLANAGGLLSNLFGGKKDPASLAASALSKSVATMAVTAGVVTINGGVGGVGGDVSRLLGGTAANSNNPIAAGNISSFAAAIKSVESGGNYSQLGPITKTGDRAYGAYQVMGANIPSWTKATLGKALSPDEFMADHGAQDSVFAKYFGQSLSKFGNARDAASVWFSGRPLSQAGGASDGYNTATQYVDKFSSALAKTPAALDSLGNTTANATQNLAGFGSGLGQLGQSLSQAAAPGASSGGGLFGWIGSLFGGGGSAAGGAGTGSALGGLKKFAKGGVSQEPAIFGEAGGAEAAIPLPDGRSVPVTLRVNQSVPSNAGKGNVAPAVSFSSEVHNYSSASVKTEATTDQRGNRQVKYIISDTVGDALATPGGGAARTLKTNFGVKKQGIRR